MKALGIDLGGTSVKLGIVQDGAVISSASVPTRKNSDYEGIVGDIVAAAKKLCDGHEIEKAGIGSPGLINSSSGKVCYSNNIRWSDYPLRDDISKALGVPAVIANDAKCAALGEAVVGAGKSYSRVAMLTLGTGVGGGFAVNGKIESGNIHADASGIFGHMTLVPGGRECNCGRKGCLESYCSATAVSERAQSVFGRQITAKEVFRLALERNRVAKKIVDDFAGYLAVAIVNLANILRPECFVIGGGMAASAEMFLPIVRKKTERELYGEKYAPVKIVSAQLGNAAGIVGATLL